MKNLIPLLLLSLAFFNSQQVFAQCEPVLSYNTNWADLPACWSLPNGNAGIGFNGFGGQSGGAFIRSRELINLQGTYSISTRTITNVTSGFTLQLVQNNVVVHSVGVTVTSGNFKIQTFQFNVAGPGYIQIAQLTQNAPFIALGNMTFTGTCPAGTDVDAKVKDITISLNANGTANITPENLDDGSGDICGNSMTLSIDKSSFTCADLGANSISFTATRGDGATDNTTATVTVEPALALSSSNVYLDASGNANYTAEEFLGSSSTNCSEINYSVDRLNFSCTDLGSQQEVVVIASYGALTSSKTLMVNVLDTISPMVIAKDLTIQLDPNTGIASITADMVDNGSSDNCVVNLQLSKTQFTCSDLGENEVTLTVTDDSANSATATAIVTITSIIEDESITASNSGFCPDGTTGTTVSTGSSVLGIDYYLRNSANNSIIDGPIAGTGNALDFNAGNLSINTTFNVFGKLPAEATTSGALNFDGVNDYVEAGGTTRGISAQLTVSAWVKSTRTGIANFIVSKYNASNGFLLFINTNGKASLDGRDVTGGYKSSGVSTVSVNDGQWHHLAGTINSTTGSWKIYVDGVLENQSNLAAGSTLANSNPLIIGTIDNTYFQGQIDGVALWNVAHDQATIQANIDCLEGLENQMVGYFDFNEGSGLTVADKSPNALAGTLKNMGTNSDWTTGPALVCGTTCSFQMTTELTIGDTEAPTVLVKNISIQQGTDEISITPADIDNGSTDNCTATENLIFSLDKTIFDCGDLGSNVVTITVTDANGNTASEQATVTIISSILDQPVTAVQNNVCAGSSTTISVTTTETNLNYVLRNESDEIVDGPFPGTGQSIDFNTGSITNATTFNVFGLFDGAKNEAMKVAGTSGYVSIPSSPSLQLAENWTIEAWVKPTQVTSAINIVETYDASGGYVLRGAGGNWVAYAMQSSSSSAIVSTQGGMVVDQWTHVAATFNETTNELKIYVNGVLSATNTAATIDQRGSNTSIKLGARGDDSRVQNEHLQDEVRIWNVERTAQEIDENKAKLLAGDEAGIVAYYDYNDLTFVETGMTIEDKSVNANHGSIVGAYASTNFVDGSFTDHATACGYQMATTQTITINDTEAPIAIAQDLSIRLDANNMASITGAEVDNGSTDNCGSLSFTLDKSTFNETNLGPNQIVLTVDDGNGNTSTDNATVTVLEFKTDQTITFGALANKQYGEADITLAATSSSSLPVAFQLISGNATLTGSTLTITGAGAITVRASQGGDNDFLEAAYVDQSFEVNKAPLTISAEDKSITYGAALPTLTKTFAGFVNGESESDLESLPSISTAATNESGAGTYDITLSLENGKGRTAQPDNYEITLVNGTLTIDPAALTVAADAKSMVFGGNIPTLTLTYTGFVNNETAANLTSEPTLSTAATSSSDAGEYTITLSGGSAINYSFNLINSTMTITKAIASIAISGLEQTADGTAKNVIATTTPADLSFIITYNGNANAPVNSGDYDVVVTINETNWTGTNEATFVILPAPLGISGSQYKSIEIYPTPAVNIITIKRTESDVASAVIYNVEGSELVRFDLKSKEQYLDVSEFPIGLYLIQILNSKSELIHRQKLLIKK